MKIFLIRHGETVDNVANVYAGVKDSVLTVHGSLQADRLANFFADNGLRFTHIFSSDLQRAQKTANAIRLAQANNDSGEQDNPLEVTALPVLREQDFGYYEGRPFYARPRNSNKSGKENRRLHHQDDPDFKDVESKEVMSARTNAFLQEHLVPIMKEAGRDQASNVAIVSHGILLSHLWRSFLLLLPKNSVYLSPGLSVGSRGMTPLEYLGGWSNTGYLELEIQESGATSNDAANITAPSRHSQPDLAEQAPSPLTLYGLKMIVRTVNGKEHLMGLKRTRGGVGSSKHDEGQKTIESFFKKRKV